MFEYVERNFIFDSVKLSDGLFRINCLDPLILTEEKKAQMPTASPARLSAAITGTPTTFNYIDAPDNYFGALTDEVYLRIDSEVILCEVTDTDELTVITRGVKSEDHDAGASIQDCIHFDGTHGIDAIEFALTNYTTTPAAYIGDYSAVIALLPAFVLDDAFITKPRAVSGFIDDMIKLGNLITYFDEVAQEIVIDYTPELEIQPISITESVEIERDSVDVDPNIKNQFTRLSHLWAPVDITKETEENYAIRFMQANLPLESEEKLGQVNEKPAYKNMLLSNSSGDSLLGVGFVDRVLSNTAEPPKLITATIKSDFVGTNSGGEFKLGSIVSLSTSENQDKDGNALSELFQVLSIRGNPYDDYKVKMRRYQSIAPDDVDFVVEEGGVNFDLSDVYAPAAGSYTVYINPGVTFGSYDTSLPAFTTGTQASGVSFTIINRGEWLGMGGAGGDCEISSPPSPSAATNGQPGGLAFEATVDCIIDNGSGLIWAGGGGAGGGSQAGYTFAYFGAATGGGGGQGFGVSISGQYSNGGVSGSVGFDGRRVGGNRSAPGLTDGGEWGEPGASTSEASGGLAGIAIKSDGNTLTITSGNNDLNIRGRRT